MTTATKQRPAQRPGESNTRHPVNLTAPPAYDHPILRSAAIAEADEQLLFEEMPNLTSPGWLYTLIHQIVADPARTQGQKDVEIDSLWAGWYREQTEAAVERQEARSDQLQIELVERWRSITRDTGDPRIAASLTVAWAFARGRMR